MVKKPLSRVRRKKGAVLFAVIAVMALLITMASTAYFTAKNAYNSVISNYSYSQLYLSAISVSDMVVEAVMNDSTAVATSADGSDPQKNYYDSLRDAVLNINTVGDTISAHTPNITDPTASESAIIAELAATSNVTVPGAIDGVVVNIKLDKIEDLGVSPTVAEDGVSTWYLRGYNYKFTTDAYYRGSAISVEDVVVANKLVLYTPDPGSNGGSGSTYNPGSTETIPGPGNGGGGFSTFFTATGQKLEEGKIVRSTRTVKIKTHEISDDAFFQNSSTYFVNGNNNDFVGGITSTGSVYLEKFTTNISGANNDWWIGDDLVMTNNNANNLNLTNQNSLYVGDDLVIAANGNITAKDIYVEGDLYIMGQAKFNGNLHVSGNIYYEMGDTVIDEDGNVVASPSATASADGVYLGSTKWDHYTNGWEVTGDLDVNGTVNVPQGSTNDAKITVKGQQVIIPTGTSASKDSNNIGTYDPSSINVDYTNRIPDTDDADGDGNTDEFANSTSNSTVSSAIQNQVGSNTEYYNYTSPSETLDNEVEINFGNLTPVKDAENNVLYYEYNDPDTGLNIRSEDNNLNGNISVNIPYNENGYVLDIDAESISSTLGCNVNITYNIETSDDSTKDAMPIVLKNNILIDADGDGQADDPGFSWQGNNYGSNDNSQGTIVQTLGDGNVVFEMGNLDANGNLVKYDPNKDGEITVVTYVAGQKEVIGTEAQCGVVGADGNLTESEVNSMLQSGTSIPKNEYQNRIMLVSNKNNGMAVDAARQNNAFCGYIYAPNGELNNYAANGETAPMFGGMIVSTYNAELSKLYYAEPKPSIISSMLGSLNLWSPGGGGNGANVTITVPDSWSSWSTPPTPPGPGTWGTPQNTDEWNEKGSNFVG